MRDPKRLARFAALRHRVTVQGGHEGVRCSRRVEKDRGHSAADGCAFHDTNEKPHDGQQGVGVKPEDRDQDRQRDRHRHRTRKPRCRTHHDAQKKT
jgi:hypothetical protein